MGCFDGYLICSDFDGTFFGSQDLSENIKAIKYFTENGGKFTFATGRGAEFFKEKGLFPLINAPLCIYNGAAVWDNEKWEIIKTAYTDLNIKTLLAAIKPKQHLLNEIHIFDEVESCYNFVHLESADEALLNKKVLKTVFTFDTADCATEFQNFVANHKTFKNCVVLKGWDKGVELNSNLGTKGAAALFIKEYLKNIHTVIGIGDYENDIPLVKMTDLGIAVGNAQDSVKTAADRVIVPCEENAIAYLINNLQQLL
ncbi:MAG: HAD-IIB family hydrolase [Ruminococcaceae bacterium]|nr:HAD-IIB family hydrolase [Oscillospiraceae bacterium]